MADREKATAVRTTLERRVAKLEALSTPPTRIVLEYVYQKPGLTSKRFVRREEHGNAIVEMWEGLIEDPPWGIGRRVG
jgi:hypothetical protein